MSLRSAQHDSLRGLAVAVLAVLTLLVGLAHADAGFTIMHNEKAADREIPLEAIEAEDWIRAVGIENQPTGDTSGTSDVVAIHDGDWTEYQVDEGDAAAGDSQYVVEVRVASAITGGVIDLTLDGDHVGSVEVPNTGGWNNWATAYATVELASEQELLRLTYKGTLDTELFKLNWISFQLLDPELLRSRAVNQMITALESYAAVDGSFVVDGGGHNGYGQGWAFYEGETYTKSIANVLIDRGHLPSTPLHDQLWTSHTSIAGDVLIYTCKDRVAVFTREGFGQPSAVDRDWWQNNGCNPYPVGQLGVTYYAVSNPISPESELQRQHAVNAFVDALESYGAEHGTYRVLGGGHKGNGNSWAFYEGGVYSKSTANVLIEGGHLPSPPPHDQRWTSHTSIVGDVLVYPCGDRVAVFTREGGSEPSAHDLDWWDSNGCNRYPIDRLGVTYFALSAPL